MVKISFQGQRLILLSFPITENRSVESINNTSTNKLIEKSVLLGFQKSRIGKYILQTAVFFYHRPAAPGDGGFGLGTAEINFTVPAGTVVFSWTFYRPRGRWPKNLPSPGTVKYLNVWPVLFGHKSYRRISCKIPPLSIPLVLAHVQVLFENLGKNSRETSKNMF